MILYTVARSNMPHLPALPLWFGMATGEGWGGEHRASADAPPLRCQGRSAGAGGFTWPACCLAARGRPRAATLSFFIWSSMDWMSVLSSRRCSCSSSSSVSPSQVQMLFRSDMNCCHFWRFCFVLSSLLRACAWRSSHRSITPDRMRQAQMVRFFSPRVMFKKCFKLT